MSGGRAWFVYIVRCRDGSLYTGVSTDVEARVAVHNAGRGARYTRARRPVTLLHRERRATRARALSREAAIKRLPRRAKLRLIAEAALGVAIAAVLLQPVNARAEGERPRARPDRVLIPAGPFIQGSNKGAEDERPSRTTTLRAFRIDRTEVTQGAYARCVARRRCAAPPGYVAPAAGSSEDALPMTGVTWHEAAAYCAFAGGRLPSEAEWEKAARGSDGRDYPWGEGADCSRANWGNFQGEGPCAAANPGKPVTVGSYPSGASPFGVLDLGGNVWEWVADKYDLEPDRRVVRGGSCCSYFVDPRAPNRNAWAPEHRDGDLGFRCASR